MAEDRTYYLYGTGSPLGKWGFDAYASKDLQHWEGPFRVFQPPDGTLKISFHQPNHRPERPVFRRVEETDTGLRLKP